MTNCELKKYITEFVKNDSANYVSEEDAIAQNVIGLQLYDDPLVGFAAADDRLFIEEFKKEGVVHPQYRAPEEWLPGAKTVISFFLPFTDAVRVSNRTVKDVPYEDGIPQHSSIEWLHARIEGQMLINRLTDYIQLKLENEGYRTICPTTSGELSMITPYCSTWSERHAAFAAGLGTFGLSKGMITAKGISGRFGSVITDAEFAPTERPYTTPFEYCTMCGACMHRCPVGAIDISRGCALGKDQQICRSYMDGGKLPPHGPNSRVRYGCGKCQVGVPCERGIPERHFSRIIP